jgi:predicted enzyme related to lactoylglutathione lyase
VTDIDGAERHGTLAWFEIHVNDLEQATDFYGKVFGWTFEPLAGFGPGDYMLIKTRAGGSGNGGVAHTPGRRPPTDESSVLYLLVDDIQSAVEAAVAAGGTVYRPRMNIGGDHGYCAIVRDPEGNLVGLWSGV